MNKSQFYTGGRGKGWFILLIPVVLGLAGAAVMWLWNATLPELTGAKPITYWQSVGLFVLCKLLFGNFKGPGGNQGPIRSRMARLKEKWANATPEERQAMKDEWRKRCGMETR